MGLHEFNCIDICGGDEEIDIDIGSGDGEIDIDIGGGDGDYAFFVNSINKRTVKKAKRYCYSLLLTREIWMTKQGYIS